MNKKPRVKKRAVRKPDKYDRVAREAFTPGGKTSNQRPSDHMQLWRGGKDTGFGWNAKALADFLRRELSPRRTK